MQYQPLSACQCGWVLLNPRFGVVSQMIYSITGFIPPWFSDPTWAKMGILYSIFWSGR